MRLLMLNNEFPPLGGGTGTVNRALLDRFATVSDVEIELITSALGNKVEEDNYSPNIHITKVPVRNRNIHHSSNRELLEYSLRAFFTALRQHRARPFHLCMAWSTVPAGGIAALLRTFTNLPYIVRVSGPDIPGFEQRYSWLYPVLTPLIRQTWKNAEAVVAKCQGEADMVRAVYPPAAINLIPNGVDLKAFTPADLSHTQNPLRLLCVARLIERKGQRHLIEAVRRLTDQGMDVHLELVGTGDALAPYQEYVRQLGLEDKVYFAGYIPREEIASVYARAHVFVLPSYNEGMSVATLEAMAAGLPIVITRTGGTTELVKEGLNGFSYDKNDPTMLVKCLIYMANNRSALNDMGKASHRIAEQYSWENASRSFEDLFFSIENKFQLPIVQAKR
jgi:phosphatidyl-myo-inositol dimannoside synthase